MLKAIRLYALSFPFALVASLFCTWFAARISLGRWPQPSLDDPKQIGGWFDVPFVFTRLFFEFGWLAFLLAFAILAYQAIRHPSRRRRSLLTITVSILFMILATLFFRWDPWRIGDWFMD